MTDDLERRTAEAAREQREAELVRARVVELYENPIKGNFDISHLQAVHAYLFQDVPAHQPGVIRERTEDAWVKHRQLEGQSVVYDVHYANQDIEQKLTIALHDFGGPAVLRGLGTEAAASRLAELYGDLDYAHGFYEGNSRTLREFTRELALEAGFTLDWVTTGADTRERNALYMARDIAVLERAFPELTEDRAMQTNDRAEYEAFFVLNGLRSAVGEKSLEAIIREGLSPDFDREREEGPEWDELDSAERGAIMVVDAAANVLGKLADVVADILSFGAATSRRAARSLSQGEQFEERDRAVAAIASIRNSMERGEGLNVEDVRNLTPEHLTNIAAKGDDYLRMLVRDVEREREQDWGYRER